MAMKEVLAQLSALLTLDDKQFKQGLRGAKKEADAFGSGISKLGGAIAAAFSVAAIVNFTKTAIQAWDEQEKANNKLFTALKGNEKVTQNLIRQASELATKTLFSDDAITNAQAILASFVKDEWALETLTPLVLDFAQAFGIDLVQAAKLVSKAYMGSATTIRGTAIELDGAAGSTERLTSLTEKLTAAVGGQAEVAASSGAGAIQQLSKSWGEFAESIGYLVGPALTKLAKNLNDVTVGMTALINSKSLNFWDKLYITLLASTGQIDESARVIMERYDPAAEEATLNTNQLSESLDEGADGFDEIGKAAEIAKSNIDGFNQSLGAFTPAIDNSLGVVRSGDLGAGAPTSSGGPPPNRMGMFPTPDVSIEKQVQDIGTYRDTYISAIEEMAAVSAEKSDLIQGAFLAIGDSLGYAIGEIISGEAKFSDVAGRLISDILRIIAGYLSQSVAASFAGGASSGGPAAPFTGAAAAAAALSLFSSIVPALMADGGIVPGGYPGDTYPAMLSSGEMVIPPDELPDMGGGAVELKGRFVIQGQDLVYIVNQGNQRIGRYK